MEPNGDQALPDETEGQRALRGEDHRRFRYYFVDEAGDPALFNAKKQVVVGRDGCSRFFLLGALDVPEPETLAKELEQLRQQLLADPYFRGVPSFDPARKKTAVAFHAKDDLPEVRREVFSLLLRHQLKFYAVVRDKHVVVGTVRRRNAKDPTYRYRQNDLYDELVRRLFKDRLHKAQHIRVSFATRGSADRTAALRAALEAARKRFDMQWGKGSEAPIEVEASSPSRTVCLQAVDYFLWALQRRLEREESRYLDLVWEKVGLVILADTGDAGYGSYHTKDRPIPPPPPGSKAQPDDSAPGLDRN